MTIRQDRFLSALLPPPTQPALRQTLVADVNPQAMPQVDPNFYNVGAAVHSGTGVSVDNQLFQDARTLSNLELMDKYGDVEGQRLIRARAGGMANFQRDLVRPRTDVEVITDTGTGVVSGFLGGLGGIAALGGGIINEDLGTGISNIVNKGLTEIRDNQSNGLNDRRRAVETQGFLSSLDNEATYQRESATEGEGLATLRRIGRNFADQATISFSEGATMGDGIAQGVGSLVGGGAVSGTLKAVGKAAIRGVGPSRAAAVALQSPRTFDGLVRAGQFADRARMPLSIGALEGGGAYMGAVEEIMGMSHEQLLETSQSYRDLIAADVEPQEARIRVANTGGLLAGAIQAPIGVATGALVSKFEGAPLRFTSLRTGVGNVGRETVEEAIQSGAGEFAQNKAIRSTADNTYDLAQGVGEGAAQGAIYGAGTAGVFAGPSTAAGMTQEGISAVGRVARGIQERGREINNRNVVDVTAQTAQAVRAAAQPVDTTPVVNASVDPIQDQAELNENLDVLSTLSQQFDFNPAEYQPQTEAEVRLMSELDPTVQYDIFDVMSQASNKISQEDVTPAEKFELALMISNLQERVTGESIQQVLELEGKATPGGTMARETRKIVAAQEAIANNPKIRQALIDGINATPDVKVSDVEDISTPQGVQAARKVALQAVLTPENIAPEVVERLLKHSTSGILTPQQTSALRSSAALTKTVKAAAANAQKLGAQAPAVARVAFEIQAAEYDKSGTAGPSVAGHYDVVNRLASYGLTDEAKSSLEAFQAFAQHMANKLNAVNASFTGRDGNKNPEVRYDSYSPRSGWTKNSNSWTSVRFNENSIKNSQQIGVDAEFVVDSFNSLVSQYPDLGVSPIDPVRLDAGLQKAPKAVIEASKQEQRASVQKQEAPIEPVVAEAVPEVQEEVEQIEEPTERVYTAKEVEELLKAEREKLAKPKEEPDQQGTVPNTDQPILEAVTEVAEPEAKPEVQATNETAPVEQTQQRQAAPQIQEVFPNVLRDTNGDQLLLNGFTLDNESRTRLIGEGAITANDVVKGLQSPEAFQAVSGLAKYKLSPQVTAAYNATVLAVSGPVFSKMMERLESSKNFAPYVNGADPSNAIRRTNLRLLNVLERQGDKLIINPTIASAAVLALSDWLAQNSVAGPQRSDEDIARKLKIDVSEVTDDLRTAYNTSINSQQAHDSLATTLGQFLGLKAKPDVKNGLTDGLLLSLAGELLDSAEAAKLIDVTPPMLVGGRYMVFMKTNKDTLGLSKTVDGPSFMGQTTLISQMVLQESSVAGYTIGAPSGNKLFQLQGGGAPVTDAQQKAAAAENAVPQTVNRPMLDLFRHLGTDGVVSLFANGELPGTLNANDREAKAGQNLAFISAYETAMGLVQEMESAASETGQALEEVKVFREYAYSSVNRLQQQGQFGDQASKLTRELITPYASVLDMTNPAEASMWRRGIAQAIGVKVEKLRPEHWEAELEALLSSSAIQEAILIMRDPTATPSDQLIGALKAALDPDGKKGVTPVQVHALKSYADFTENDDPKAFFTHMYVEADGVTDGPTNSMIYMRKGGFDAEMVRGLARGGLVFSSKPTPLHELFDPEDGPKLLDTYEVGAKRLAESLSSTIQGVTTQTKTAKDKQALEEHASALLSAMRTLLGDEGFSYEEAADGGHVFTIKRKQLKNPLTVTVYGSSPSGIAAKIAKEMVRELYSQISEAHAKAAESDDAQGWMNYMFTSRDETDTFIKALSQLGRNEVRQFKERDQTVYYLKSSEEPVVRNASDPVKFTVTPKAMTNLASALETFYVTPMVQAINTGMGSSVNGSEVIRQSTNFMSALAKTAFTNAIQRELQKQKAAGGSMAEGLSPNELKKVLARVAFLFPYMEGDSVTVNVKGLSKGLMDDKPDNDKESAVRPAATFKDSIHTKLTIPMPTVAGVAGAAYVNISYGDGRMIIEASPNLVGGRLMVFDGINLALKDATRNGQAINASVLKALQAGTPFQDLQKTFDNMVETIDLGEFSSDELRQVFEDVTAPNSDPDGTHKNFIQEMMGALQYELNEAVLDEQARLAVLKRVHLSSDHMAALAAPASTEQETDRIDLGGMTSEEAAVELEQMFRAERAKIASKTEADLAPSEDLGSTFDVLPEHETGVRLVNTNRLRSMMEGLRLPAVQMTIIKRALAALSNNSWTVVMGNQEQANAYAKATGIPFTFVDGDHGLTAPARKTVIVANGSSETLAHELIHAATIDRVVAYYNDISALDPASLDAISRLDALMIQWLNVAEDSAGLRNKKTRDTVRQAVNVVTDLINAGKPAEALNEFIAWNLSNQSLMTLNSSIKVESAFARIAKSVVNGLRKLFNLPPVGTDLNSNIRFNAMVLMSEGLPPLQSVLADQLLMHSSRTRPDLAEIMQKFAVITAGVDKGFEKFYGPKPSELALQYGHNLAKIVSDNGFNLTNDERRAFVMIVAAYRANRVADPAANVKLDAYYREVLAQLNQSNMMDDPTSQDPDDQNLASDRIRLLDGSVNVGTDVHGLSLLLPMFVALGATSSQAQKLFSRIKVRDKKLAAPDTTADGFIKSTVSRHINNLMDYTYGLKANQKVGEEIQKIVAGLAQQAESEKGLLVQALEAPANMVREANERVTDAVALSVDKANDGLDFLIKQAKGTSLESFAETGGRIAQSTLSIMSKRRVADATSKLTSIINQSNMPQEFRAFVTELMGVNEGNVDILNLVKIARATIHKVRQTYRKLMPQQIADEFSRKLSQQEWSDIHIGMGQTGISVMLDQGMSSGAVVDLFSNPGEVTRLMSQKEADIRRLFGANAPAILTEAGELADLMRTGKPAHGLMKRNALAIANRVGEVNVGSFDLTSAETQAIDGYVSLLSLSQVAPSVLKSLSGLAATETAGLSFMVSLIAKAQRDEMERVPPRLKYNVPKGYMPSERQGSFKAIPMDQLNSYTKAGYRLVGSRQRGSVEELHAGRAKDMVYVATDLTPPSFKQGIMQTVRSTVFGLDATNGTQHDMPSAGLITETTAVKRITQALRRSKAPEALAPLYNEQGQIYAYERLVDPQDVLGAIETQQNAAVALGHWMGRQHEEVQAEILNDVLIERLADMYQAANRTAQTDEFVDLFELAQTDPVVADAVRLINDRDRSKLFAKMGGKFMVQKNLYEQVIGYRSISVGDLWTGNTRVAEENRDALANYLTGLFGAEAYRRLTVAEQGWTNLMGDARVAIVVKSVLVPAINGLANFYQLMANGIGPVEVAKKSAEKLRETHLYSQNHLKYQELENKLAAAQGAKRPDLARRIETEMRKIEDLNKRLSIWPLIAAGEFTQVTEGLTDDDMEMKQGRVWDYLSKLADRLPPSVKTAGRYAIVAKDTALFEGLARTVAYTDFVAKAVLYDHLTQKMKLSTKDAQLRITNEFVNYDLLGGRMRSKAEEVGLLWFWSFKLRSIKVAASMIRNNPLHALLTSFAPGIEQVGTVMDDNMLSLMGDGRWDNSLGPQNAFRALSLNPISQMM